MVYVIKYSLPGRRYTLVHTYTPGLTGISIDFTKEAAQALSFDTRAAAKVMADKLNAQWVRPGKRSRFTVVPEDYNTPSARARRRTYRPRKAATLTPEQARKLALELQEVRSRAGAAGVALPHFEVHVTAGKGCCQGGKGRAGEFYITIDTTVIDDPRPGYFTSVISHEVAHVADCLARDTTDHTPTFYALLRKLCPLEFQAYELSYRFQAAYTAGIRLADALPEIRPAIAARLIRVRR